MGTAPTLMSEQQEVAAAVLHAGRSTVIMLCMLCIRLLRSHRAPAWAGVSSLAATLLPSDACA